MIIQYKEHYIYDTLQSVTRQSITQHKVLHDKKVWHNTNNNMAQQIHFTKMHGCGNNYIYLYLPDNPIENLPEASIKWSRQHFGIGSDGLITIEKSKVADFKMRIFNNDGSEAMMCGNGVRCCGKFVRDHHLTEKSEVTFETLAGIKTLQLALPPVSEQKKIVNILLQYDNLIENNQKQIKLLEEAAQRLYKEWFVFEYI